MSSEGKFYLPGLLGLRFIAAFAVFFGHLEQAKEWVKIPAFPFPFSGTMAGDGVTLFFVLSGFLITHLLLSEQTHFGRVSVSSFYRRRILRIWPLYYFFTFLTFFVLPKIAFLDFPNLDMAVDGNFFERLLLFVFMSPHIAIILFTHPGVGGPLWSVGVEEYFYVVWPHVIERFKRFLPWSFLVVIILPTLLRRDGFPFYPSSFIKVFFYLARFDCMAIGGLAAWLCFHRHWLAKYFFAIPVQLVAYGFAIKHLFVASRYGDLEHAIYSTVFAIIIVNVALNPKTLVRFENPILKFMGKISYGFYVFQWLSNVICLKFFMANVKIDNSLLQSFAILILVFSVNTCFSLISYFIVERPFLKFRTKYSRLSNHATIV